MQDRHNIAVFVDYDNIEIGVRSTLRRDFDVSLVLDALKERGDIVAKFAYANWSRQEGAARQMAESAVQMVQRLPSPRGDKNGGDINLALDALEMAFTHDHVNAFAIVSGDSDFIPLVNKLKEYGKVVFVVGGKGFTSTILQQNCHEFVSFESLLQIDESTVPAPAPERERDRDRDYRDRDRRFRDRDRQRDDRPREERSQDDRPREDRPAREDRPPREDRPSREERQREYREKRQQMLNESQQRPVRPAALDLALSMPLVERALQVLERRGVQPQLGLLKSTMLQLDSSFSESTYGARSFSEFVEKLKRADYIFVKGGGGRYYIERKGPPRDLPKPEDALQFLRDTLENHRLEVDDGRPAPDILAWMEEEHSGFEFRKYGFQEFTEFLNFAQDKQVVRLENHIEAGVIVHLGAEFYPPALPEPVREEEVLSIHDIQQPIVRGQPTATGEIPVFEEPPKPRKRVVRKKTDGGGAAPRTVRSRKKKSD